MSGVWKFIIGTWKSHSTSWGKKKRLKGFLANIVPRTCQVIYNISPHDSVAGVRARTLSGETWYHSQFLMTLKFLHPGKWGTSEDSGGNALRVQVNSARRDLTFLLARKYLLKCKYAEWEARVKDLLTSFSRLRTRSWWSSSKLAEADPAMLKWMPGSLYFKVPSLLF